MRLPFSFPAAAVCAVLATLLGLSPAARAGGKHSEIAAVNTPRPGPVQIAPEPDAMSQSAYPDDFVDFDPSSAAPANAAITVVGGGFNDTLGATTVVASSSVGSGVAFHPTTQGCISPSQQLDYWDDTVKAFVAIDLTQSTLPRTLVPVPTNTSLVPGSYYTSAIPGMVWDYSTNTILYIDNGSATSKSTIARGIYRLNPVTGVNTLYAPFTSGTVNAIAIKQDGSAVYVFNANGTTSGTNASVSQIAQGSGTLTVVDGGPSLYGTALT